MASKPWCLSSRTVNGSHFNQEYGLRNNSVFDKKKEKEKETYLVCVRESDLMSEGENEIESV